MIISGKLESWTIVSLQILKDIRSPIICHQSLSFFYPCSVYQDVTNKLADLMWNDWQSDVRRAAAQCLGKTGHGRAVHDHLREKMLTGDERTRLEALNKIGQLGRQSWCYTLHKNVLASGYYLKIGSVKM